MQNSRITPFCIVISASTASLNTWSDLDGSPNPDVSIREISIEPTWLRPSLVNAHQSPYNSQ